MAHQAVADAQGAQDAIALLRLQLETRVEEADAQKAAAAVDATGIQLHTLIKSSSRCNRCILEYCDQN